MGHAAKITSVNSKVMMLLLNTSLGLNTENDVSMSYKEVFNINLY